MSDPIVKSPFSDAVGPNSVPRKGSGKGLYDSEPGLHPSRDGGVLPELTRDRTFGQPSKSSGPVTHSPFKDAVE